MTHSGQFPAQCLHGWENALSWTCVGCLLGVCAGPVGVGGWLMASCGCSRQRVGAQHTQRGLARRGGVEASGQSTAPGPAGLWAGRAGPALRPQPGLPRSAIGASAPRGWLTNVCCLRAVCQACANEGSLRPLGCHPWQLYTHFPPRASLGVSGSPASVCLVVIALYHTSLHPCIRARGLASWPPPATLPQGQVQCQAGPLPAPPPPGVCCGPAHSWARGHRRPHMLAAISSSFQALRRCPKMLPARLLLSRTLLCPPHLNEACTGGLVRKSLFCSGSQVPASGTHTPASPPSTSPSSAQGWRRGAGWGGCRNGGVASGLP